MKKTISVLVCLFILVFLFQAFANGLSVKVPKEVMEQAVAQNDAFPIIEDYLIPALYENDLYALEFASELNISNGNPHTRDFGERGMFGKLVNINTALKHQEDYLENIEEIRAEVCRLLVGPWFNGGWSKFTFNHAWNAKQLDFETGKWVSARHVPVIHISHMTEYCGYKHGGNLVCDYETLIDNSYYLASFQIVRKD